MADEKLNGPYEPATDESVEKWQVQVDYGQGYVISNIARGELGGILARLAHVRKVLGRVLNAEAYRDPDRSVREVLGKTQRAEAEKEALP